MEKVDCQFWNWNWDVCADLTNVSTMYIELIIGGGLAVGISYLLKRRADKKKEARGIELTELIIRDSIIGLRKTAKDQIWQLEHNAHQLTPKINELYFQQIKDFIPQLNSMLAITGDTISPMAQRALSRIIAQMSHTPDYKNPIDLQIILESIRGDCTDFLKDNQRALMNVKNQMVEIIINKIKSSKNVNMEKFWMERYQENIDEIKDVLFDFDEEEAKQKIKDLLKKAGN